MHLSEKAERTQNLIFPDTQTGLEEDTTPYNSDESPTQTILYVLTSLNSVTIKINCPDLISHMRLLHKKLDTLSTENATAGSEVE